MSRGGAETRATGLQEVVEVGRGGCGGDTNGGSFGGTDRRGGGGGRDVDGNRLSRWEDNLLNLTLGTDPNYPLVCAPGLERYHPIMSTIGDTGGRLERDIFNNRSVLFQY